MHNPLVNCLLYVKELLAKGSQIPDWLNDASDNEGSDLALNQFSLKKQILSITRADAEEMSGDLFALSVNDWSKVAYPLDGGAHFFFIQSREDGRLEEASEVIDKQRFLSNEVVLFYFHDLLGQIQEAKAINLSL